MKMIEYMNQKYMELRMEYDRRIINEAICALADPVSENIVPQQIHKVNFVLENMIAHSGGHTSVLRLATEVEKQGYRVQYVLLNNQSVKDADKIAEGNLSGYKGRFVKIKEFLPDDRDIVVATASNTVFPVVKMKGYKMYFIQDYEPSFFSFGDRYLMAKKTYELGLHMVSLGKWNCTMIRKECRNVQRMNYIEFPCETSEYPYVGRDFSKLKNKKEIVIAVYIKMVGRRLPMITQELFCYLKRFYKKRNINVKILYFGEHKGFKCKGGVNLGKLTKRELYELYQKADFGYVSSFSNISLVTYEMISAGLPVIEIEDGTFQEFFPENCAILADIMPKNFCRKIDFYIKHPQNLGEMVENAKKYVEGLSWQKSAKQFCDLFSRR